MDNTKKPEFNLAKKVLPPPLFETLKLFFSAPLPGCALVGGTALSGFYAGHRRSDDLDLFCRDEASFEDGLRRIKNLKSIVTFHNEQRSPNFFKGHCEYKGHLFTVDLVLDTHLFKVGEFVSLDENINVASLQTLFMMKASTLVSQASEKDLYDLLWLIQNLPDASYEKLISSGQIIDGGLSAESLLMNLSTTQSSLIACDFSLDEKTSKEQIFKEISDFRKQLIIDLTRIARRQPGGDLAKLVSQIKRWL